MSHAYRGGCFCGAVQVEVEGKPEAMGYCHCESCRHWSAGPVNAFTLWKPDAVRITRGQEELESYQKTSASRRRWCRRCGGHVLTEHPGMGLVDVYAALLPDLTFEPALHVHYQESVLRIPDGLPKMKDVPAELGGSGETLEE
ncbi:GFA family protein [Halomonas koreensis]|uniref:GFA family protein n=1 Tax=Halomonas koreensis TaxID=245385 RepID=A0ABU1G0X0_9GAMM|nr:GFA family protein [Halomonas koreensis]MDR5866238.1 GFA family protein [Halomonas koreensis]